jgi:hypothetical protein
MRNRTEPRWSEQVRMVQRCVKPHNAVDIKFCAMSEFCVGCDGNPEPASVCEKAFKAQPKRRDLC